jgi:hypothetical protein
VFYAAIDTTFAMYRPGANPRPLDAAHTGAPYVARHAPWYSNPLALTEEDAFYEAGRRRSGEVLGRHRFACRASRKDVRRSNGAAPSHSALAEQLENVVPNP